MMGHRRASIVVLGDRSHRSWSPALLGLALLLVLVAVAPLSARETSPELRLNVKVLSPQGKPIPNAGVVMQQLTDLRGKKVKDALNVELKTDQYGKCGLDGFVEGKILIQVIASGLRTFGHVYIVRKTTDTIVVHMQNPAPEFSIYH